MILPLERGRLEIFLRDSQSPPGHTHLDSYQFFLFGLLIWPLFPKAEENLIGGWCGTLALLEHDESYRRGGK